MSSIWLSVTKGHVTRAWPKGGGIGVGGGFTLSEQHLSTLSCSGKLGLENEQDTACSGSNERNTGFRAGKSGIPIPAQPFLANHFNPPNLSFPGCNMGDSVMVKITCHTVGAQ